MAVDYSMPVLVVDDYRTMVRIIHNLLRQIGFSDLDGARPTLETRSVLAGTPPIHAQALRRLRR